MLYICIYLFLSNFSIDLILFRGPISDTLQRLNYTSGMTLLYSNLVFGIVSQECMFVDVSAF